jgi:hypothetical protein
VRTAYNEVLNNPVLVQNILGFIGPGQHLYIATISRLLSRCYEQVESFKVDAFDSEGRPKRIAVDTHTTRMSEVCKSWARIAEAADIGVPVLANKSFLQKVAAQFLGHAAAHAKPGRQFDVSSFHFQMFMGQYADHDLLALAFDQLGLPRDGYVACAAANAGRATTVQWLLEEKHCTLQSTSSALAAVGGHLNVLIYLHKIKSPFHPNTSMRAARNGHLNILQFLHAYGYAWHADTCKAAAHGGHLSILQWLYEQECPRDAAMLKRDAAAADKVDVMEWLMQRDGDDLPSILMSDAAGNGALTMCEYLLDKWGNQHVTVQHKAANCWH